MTRAGGYSMLQALPDASFVLTVLSVGRLLNKANLHLFIICVICYRAGVKWRSREDMIASLWSLA